MTERGFLSAASPPERRAAAVFAALMIAATIVVSLVGRDRGPNVDLYLSFAAATWSLADFLTAFLLFAQARGSRRFHFALIASAYLTSALLTIPYITAYFHNVALGSAADIGELQLPATFYLTWHTLFPILIFVAILIRNRSIDSSSGASSSVLVIAAAVCILAVAFTAAVLVGVSHLPHFVVRGHFQPPYTQFGMPGVVVLNVLVLTYLVFSRGASTSLRVGLTVAMLASTLDGVLNLVSPTRFSYAWDLGKVLIVVTSIVVMVRLLIDIARMYRQISSLIEVQSDQSAARIRALWQIATSSGLSERDHIQMILDVAIANVRTRLNVFAMLSHAEDDDVVIDAVSLHGDPDALSPSSRTYTPGTSFPGDLDLPTTLRTLDSTAVWNSPATLPTDALASALGWKSAIGTVFHVGSRVYFVLFGLMEPVSNQPFTDADRAFIEVVAANLGQRLHQHNQYERMRFQIEHDALTGVYNRTQFARFVRSGLADRSLAGIALIDLDDFRIVNERAGHLIADEVLVEIGARLNGVSESDRVCRLAGDEFAIVLGRVRDGESLDARLVPYCSAFEQPFHTGDRDGLRFMPISASIGGAEATGSSTIDDLLLRGYVALDESRQRGRGELTLFGEGLEGALRARKMHRGEFLAAINANEFFVEYQPTFELNTRTIVGAEALVRWTHRTRGRIFPGEFIEEAQRSEALYPLTLWIVERIINDFASLELPRGFRCYFNVPASVLERASFIGDLADLIHRAPWLASNLGLEVTETEVMHRVEVAIDNLNAVRDLGLLVAIDDFGTGSSSLGYLKRLPIDIVKLDKMFISGLPHDQTDVGLAQMFLGLTRQFSLVSVAEGVENEEQASWLLDHGCMIGQGFLFSKALPIEKFLDLLQGVSV